MTYKKLTILLLVSLLAINTFAYQPDDDEPVFPNVDDHYPTDWTDDQDEEKAQEQVGCAHEHSPRHDPIEEQVDEGDFNPEGNDHSGRTLQSYPKMRTWGYYGALGGSAAFKTYVATKLVPPILDYFGSALHVRYPVSGLLKVSSGSICGVATPANLRNGVAADYAYIVTADNSGSYIASSSACSFAAGSGRPIVGHTVISQYYVQATTNVLLHERNMICIMHEVVHTLGWTNNFWSRWIDPSTNKAIRNPTVSTVLDGASSVVLTVEPLRTMLRNHFGCPSLAGAYMENNGGSGTFGCHFERRQFAYEFMTSGLIYQMQISKFTLALLESMGWYTADYTYAEPFDFGEGEGCSFLTETCSRANSQFADFCSSSTRGCTTVGRGGGVCGSDSRSDNCRFQQPQVSYDCESTSASSYARLPQIQTFGRGAGSKCFTGSLNSGSAASQTTFCFKYSCSGSGTRAQLNVQVGSRTLLCSSAGPKTVSGYGGTINCPDPVEYCATYGAKTCPRNCMGRGTCVNGACVCSNGRGTDCASP